MPEKRKLWLRIGADVEFTKEEYELLQTWSRDAAVMLAEKLRRGEFTLNGETYIPDVLNLEESEYWYCEPVAGFDINF